LFCVWTCRCKPFPRHRCLPHTTPGAILALRGARARRQQHPATPLHLKQRSHINPPGPSLVTGSYLCLRDCGMLRAQLLPTAARTLPPPRPHLTRTRTAEQCGLVRTAYRAAPLHTQLRLFMKTTTLPCRSTNHAPVPLQTWPWDGLVLTHHTHTARLYYCHAARKATRYSTCPTKNAFAPCLPLVCRAARHATGWFGSLPACSVACGCPGSGMTRFVLRFLPYAPHQTGAAFMVCLPYAHRARQRYLYLYTATWRTPPTTAHAAACRTTYDDGRWTDIVPRY